VLLLPDNCLGGGGSRLGCNWRRGDGGGGCELSGGGQGGDELRGDGLGVNELRGGAGWIGSGRRGAASVVLRLDNVVGCSVGGIAKNLLLRFGDDLEPYAIRKMRVDSVTQDTGCGFESGVLKTTANIQKRELVSCCESHIEGSPRTPNGIRERRWIIESTADMGADSDYIKPEIPRYGKKARYCNKGCAKLEPEATQTLGIIGEDA
jgi:hypothetical protein